MLLLPRQSGLKPADPRTPRPGPWRAGEFSEDEARQAMVKFIRQVSKPCIAFKVLAGNRHCGPAAGTIQPHCGLPATHQAQDVVLLGMWQKYKDQVAENVACIRQILGVA